MSSKENSTTKGLGRGLGKGLDSLIPGSSVLDYDGENSKSAVEEISVNLIDVNPHQPRTYFNQDSLDELALSIKKHGVLQPLIVSKKNNRYELIAGERRLRASKIAEIEKVPVIIRDANEHEKLELAIIENIQREDLNPIDEALSYQKLIEEFSYSQEEAGNVVGKSRSTVANKLRLLSLSAEIKKAIKEGKITEGHAKALLSVENEAKRHLLFEQSLLNNFNVREVEKIANKISIKKKEKISSEESRSLYQLADELGSYLETKVLIRSSRKGGRIEIRYFSTEELNRIYQKIKNNS